MARKGLRITGFSRFILVMLILIPGAFVGSLLIKGEEVNMENIIKIFNQDAEQKEAVSNDTKSIEEDTKVLPSPPMDADVVKDLSQDIRDLKDEIRNLKRDLMDSEDEIRTLKDRIDALEKASPTPE
ncbi:MAG: hypothetical protein AAFV80_17355 [Bacteroidota bacterium]